MKKIFLLFAIIFLCACQMNIETNPNKKSGDTELDLLKKAILHSSIRTIGHYKVYKLDLDIEKEIVLDIKNLTIKQENNETRYFVSVENDIYKIKEEQEIIVSYDYDPSKHIIKNVTATLKNESVEIEPLVKLNIEDIVYHLIAFKKNRFEFAYHRNPDVDFKKLVFSKETVSNIRVKEEFSSSVFDFEGEIFLDVKYNNKIYKASTIINIHYIEDNELFKKRMDKKIPPYSCEIGQLVIEEWI